MMKKYRLVIFDLDGTLLDTREGVLSSVKYTINKTGLTPLEDSVLQTFIGPPIMDSFAKTYGISDKEKLQELVEIFRKQYKDVDLLKAETYEGIYEVFETLKRIGIKTAVATYKRQDYTENILKHFGFDQYTDIIYGADPDNKLKKKDIIQLCLEKTGIGVDEAVMVGDTEHDAEAARQLGMDFLGVTYGFGFKTAEDVLEYTKVPAATTADGIGRILGLDKEGK